MRDFSTTILASQSQVHQNLAHLLRWADHILINGEDALDRENAHEIISSLEKAVQVMHKTCSLGSEIVVLKRIRFGNFLDHVLLWDFPDFLVTRAAEKL